MNQRVDYADWLTPANLAKEEKAWQQSPHLFDAHERAIWSVDPSSVVEVGVGNGMLAHRVLSRLIDGYVDDHMSIDDVNASMFYTGVDKNADCLKLAKRRCCGHGRFINSDIRAVEAKPLADTVISFAVEKHFEAGEWRDIVKRILSLGRRAFAMNFTISNGNVWADNGIEWPHLWKPFGAVLEVLEGFDITYFEITHVEPLGGEISLAGVRRNG